MEVFISWSGERSEAVATALHGWMPQVIQRMKPWLSPADIEKGARWHSEIAVHLNDSRVGICCLTPENLDAPWLIFEAGAMSKQLDKPFVCTFLFDLKPTDVREPLAQFQATRAEKADTLKLMLTLDRALGDDALGEARLTTAFEQWWPRFETALGKIPAVQEKPAPPRPAAEMLEELLALVREQTRSIDSLSAAVYGPRAGLQSLLAGPRSEVGGGTAGFRLQDVMRTLVNQPGVEGDLARALEQYRESEPIAAALSRVKKELERRKQLQQEGADIQKASPGEGGDATT